MTKIDRNLVPPPTHNLGKNIVNFFSEKFLTGLPVGWLMFDCLIIHFSPTCVGHVRVGGGAASCCAQTEAFSAGGLTLVRDNAHFSSISVNSAATGRSFSSISVNPGGHWTGKDVFGCCLCSRTRW